MIKAGDIILLNSGSPEENYALVLGSDLIDELVICRLEKFEPGAVAEDFSEVISPSDVENGHLESDFAVSVKNVITIKYEDYEVLAGLQAKKLDKILRLLNHFSARLHFNGITKNITPSSIPVSGKVLDEEDLFSMIDASLDMWLTTGRFNDRFERELAKFLGVRHLLTTNSGSSANLLAISALTSYKLGERRLKEGDEVITVAAGFPTTINPIVQNRLVPVFVDIEPGTYNINTDQIEEAITEKTKAVFVAHTLGNPFNIDAVLEIAKKHNLWVIEDNCDALGSRYRQRYTGTFGHLATLSFYPAHHITTGEGGAVIINDPELYKIVLSFRDWGRDCWCDPGRDNTCGKRFDKTYGMLPEGYDHKYVYSHLGYNLKMTDWQAAIGLSQLRKLPEFINKRIENFNLLFEGLTKYADFFLLPRAMENSTPSWFGFLLSVKENAGFSKNDLVRYLDQKRIGTRNLFAGNILYQPAFLKNEIRMRIGNSELLNSTKLTHEHYSMLENTNFVMKNTFWLGVTPMINEAGIRTVIETIGKFFEEKVPSLKETRI